MVKRATCCSAKISAGSGRLIPGPTGTNKAHKATRILPQPTSPLAETYRWSEGHVTWPYDPKDRDGTPLAAWR
jgi:hypothetical protein